VVNQALAQRFWPNGNAVGQRIRFGDWPAAPVLQVVGVAGNGKYQSASDKFEPYLYIPERQMEPVPMTLFVYTASDPAHMASAIRAEVNAAAPDMPMYEVHTMKEIFEVHGLLPARGMAQMVGAMGAIGLVLGVLGLYAVAAFAVTRRTREIGIRMALGATAESVLRSVLASGVKVTLAGIAIGIGGALLLTRYFADYLDRVNPRDPAAFFGVSILLMLVAIAACWAPARRAARVDPAVTLKYE
jgi:putative ABC transport system permease protein